MDRTRGPLTALGVLRPQTVDYVLTVEPLYLFQVPQQRESTEYWRRNSLTVVTARVFLRRQWVLLLPPSMSG